MWLSPPETTRILAEEQIALAKEHGFPDQMARGRSLRGCAIAELDQAEEGLVELEANAALVPSWPMHVSAMLAQVRVRVRREDQALHLIERAITKGEPTRHHEDSELHRLRSETLLLLNSLATAEVDGCFREAIKIARRQSARWWELRATTSLARLLRKTNRSGEALRMLSEVYNWFTEGFDTADLKAAKALLEELSNSPC